MAYDEMHIPALFFSFPIWFSESGDKLRDQVTVSSNRRDGVMACHSVIPSSLGDLGVRLLKGRSGSTFYLSEYCYGVSIQDPLKT